MSMKRSTVYRIENAEGKGMYAGGQIANEEMNAWQSNRHPMPSKDSRLSLDYEVVFERGMKFGFSSLDQLKFWVYQEDHRVALHKEGFRVSVFTAEACVGDTQVFYNPFTRIDLHQLTLLEV